MNIHSKYESFQMSFLLFVLQALETRRKNLQTVITKNEILLSNLCEEHKSVEQILDRTAQLYRQTHLERRQMVQTWQEAVISMKSRDDAIRETVVVSKTLYICQWTTIFRLLVFSIQKINEAREAGAKKAIELQEQNEFLLQQKQNNRESELAINELNEATVRLRAQLGQLNETVQLKGSDLISMKRMLQSQNHQLQLQRQQNRKTTIECETKRKTIEELKGVNANLGEKLKKLSDKQGNALDRLKHLDDLAEAEEKALANVEMEIQRMSQLVYRSQQVLQQWQCDSKSVEVFD